MEWATKLKQLSILKMAEENPDAEDMSNQEKKTYTGTKKMFQYKMLAEK